MDKLKKLIKEMGAMYIFMLFLLLAAVVFGGHLFLRGVRHNFYRDASWGYYMKQLGLEQYPGGADSVQNILGEAKRRETDHGYVKLVYDGYTLGFLDENSSLCAIFITDNTKKLLRDGITIGSCSTEIERSYAYERKIRDSKGFILGKDSHTIADGGGIWISYESDEDGVIDEITITDGL